MIFVLLNSIDILKTFVDDDGDTRSSPAVTLKKKVLLLSKTTASLSVHSWQMLVM